MTSERTRIPSAVRMPAAETAFAAAMKPSAAVDRERRWASAAAAAY
jgi:hypothetical protein